MKVKVQTLDAKAGGDIQLDEAVFGVEPRADILHRVVTWQLHNRRGPARAARERSDVNRTDTPRRAFSILVLMRLRLRGDRYSTNTFPSR